ncbi:hypothetical protein B0H14DRAFT_2922407 [Mycena olivaceomarginata]|nr:hypothetical protein B0H14DRAFT_2922407 [Mycena olivaceomarginata]
MRMLGCVVNAQLKQMIHRNSLLIIPECPRMFGLGRQTRCVALGQWLGLHANRIGPASGGVLLLYSKNGCSGGGRRGLTEPAAHIIQRRTGCGSEVCEVSPGASPNVYQCDHRGGGIRKGLAADRAARRSGTHAIVVGRDLSASVRDVTMSTNFSVPR